MLPYAVMNPRLESGTRLGLAAAAPKVSAPVAKAAFESAAADAVAPPVIDWAASRAAAAPLAQGDAAPSAPSSWLVDFVNYLGKSKAEREPNAKIRIAAPAAPTVSPEIARSAKVER